MALPPEKIAQLQAAQKTAQDREVNQAKELINAQDIGYTSKLFVQALGPDPWTVDTSGVRPVV